MPESEDKAELSEVAVALAISLGKTELQAQIMASGVEADANSSAEDSTIATIEEFSSPPPEKRKSRKDESSTSSGM